MGLSSLEHSRQQNKFTYQCEKINKAKVCSVRTLSCYNFINASSTLLTYSLCVKYDTFISQTLKYIQCHTEVLFTINFINLLVRALIYQTHFCPNFRLYISNIFTRNKKIHLKCLIP